MSIYVYVDGENHFYRSKAHWQSLHANGSLDRVELKPNASCTNHFLQTLCNRQFTYHEKGKFFWEKYCLTNIPFLNLTFGREYIQRAVYVTSFNGDEAGLHELRLLTRSTGFDPIVVHEPTTLANHRQAVLKDTGILEKAKGVDIAFTVQVLEDAHRGNFDQCILLTSDVDYLPLIEAVRRLGKMVAVFGFRSGVGKMSPLEFTPDLFGDMGAMMEKQYQPATNPPA